MRRFPLHPLRPWLTPLLGSTATCCFYGTHGTPGKPAIVPVIVSVLECVRRRFPPTPRLLILYALILLRRPFGKPLYVLFCAFCIRTPTMRQANSDATRCRSIKIYLN